MYFSEVVVINVCFTCVIMFWKFIIISFIFILYKALICKQRLIKWIHYTVTLLVYNLCQTVPSHDSDTNGYEEAKLFHNEFTFFLWFAISKSCWKLSVSVEGESNSLTFDKIMVVCMSTWINVPKCGYGDWLLLAIYQS